MNGTNNDKCPRTVTSRCQIVYTKSKWNIHQFQIFCGEILCTVAVLQMDSSLLLWIGKGTTGEIMLNEISLGMPSGGSGDKATSASSLATTLLGTEGSATALARRLAVLLQRPVYLCSGNEFDKFTIPLVERGLIAEIKSRPELF